MPVNLPTHAHGQGYSDLNFMIPELVKSISYSKGPYYATGGDFSAAGSAHIAYLDHLDDSLAEITLGTDNYYRGVFAGSVKAGAGELLGAVEGAYNNGPWVNPDQYGKFNGVLRYYQGDQRQIYGMQAHQDYLTQLLGLDMRNTLGIQTRCDDIGQVGLCKTQARVRYATTRDDAVKQVSVSPYIENQTQWLSKFRTVAGVRGEFYHFEVASDDPRNSGTASDGRASPN